jgi:hypothetical protein
MLQLGLKPKVTLAKAINLHLDILEGAFDERQQSNSLVRTTEFNFQVSKFKETVLWHINSTGSILNAIASSLFAGTELDGLGNSLSAANSVDVRSTIRSTIALGWKSGGLMSLNGDMGAFFFSPDKIGRPQESVALISQTGNDAPAGIVIVASSPQYSCFAYQVIKREIASTHFVLVILICLCLQQSNVLGKNAASDNAPPLTQQ